MFYEVVCLCGFVATAPVAVWVAIEYCCSVCSVLLGLFPVACHVCDATSALAPLRLLSCVSKSRVFVPPTFHSCSLLAAGLFRVEHQSPFVSLGNAALATSPNSPSSKSSQVVRRASSTHVTVCYACTVQSRTRPWPYLVVVSSCVCLE